MNRGLAALLALLLAQAARGHVGSPHAYLEATTAGHRVALVVHVPRAVPGEANAQLRVLDLLQGETLEVSFRQVPPQGPGHAPAWIRARPYSADPATFHAPMPLMIFGLFEAEFLLRGPRGEGTVKVPVSALPPEPLRMPPALAIPLLALTAFLLASSFVIARAVVTDARAAEGAPRSPAGAWRGLVVGLLVAAAYSGFLGFTLYTWQLMDRAFDEKARPPIVADWIVRSGTPRVDKPLSALVTLVGRDGRPAEGLLESGGALVHLTAVATPGAQEVVHVHGQRTETGSFQVSWTPRTIGRHTVFVDFATRATGAVTLVERLIVGPAFGGVDGPAVGDGAQAGVTLPPLDDPRGREPEKPFGEGCRVRWDGQPVIPGIGAPETFSFVLAGADAGAIKELAAHAELTVLRDDLQVYDRVTAAAAPPNLRFLYGFPQAGRYRLILHATDGARFRAAAFDLEVPAR